MSNCDISLLPVELRLKILTLLSIYQLKVVVRVNRRWKEMGEDPILWRNLHLVISSKTQPVLRQILMMTRLQRLRNIHFNNPVPANQAGDVISVVIGHKSIKNLDLSFSKLSKVQPDKLGVLVRGLEELRMNNCRLSFPQLKTILKVISNEASCKMQKLYIGTNDLHQLPPDLIAQSIPKLSVFHCDNTYFLDIQAEVMFRAISHESSRMKELNILDVDLSSLSPTLITSTLSNLESANLWGTMLTQEQLEDILNMLTTVTKLKYLNLSNNDLSLIPPSIIAASISKLIKADLCHTKLIPIQITMLLTTIATNQDSRLTSIDLTGNPQAVKQISSQLLQETRNKLEHLELGYF